MYIFLIKIKIYNYEIKATILLGNLQLRSILFYFCQIHFPLIFGHGDSNDPWISNWWTKRSEAESVNFVSVPDSCRHGGSCPYAASTVNRRRRGEAGSRSDPAQNFFYCITRWTTEPFVVAESTSRLSSLFLGLNCWSYMARSEHSTAFILEPEELHPPRVVRWLITGRTRNVSFAVHLLWKRQRFRVISCASRSNFQFKTDTYFGIKHKKVQINNFNYTWRGEARH